MVDQKLTVGIQEKPKSIGQWIILSLQHVFAMFGATVLVPLLTGLDVGVALVASGVGTLIYILSTKGKVPVYLGSSFAYIGTIIIAATSTGFDSAYIGLMAVGIIYVIIATIIYFAGSGWIKKLLPPVVIGPMIIIIGMSLAPTAISSTGLDGASFDQYTYRQTQSVAYSSSAIGDASSDNLVYYIDNNTVYSYDGTDTNVLSLTSGERVYAYASNPTGDLEGIAMSIYELDGGQVNVVAPFAGYAIIMVAVITFFAVVLFSMLGKGFVKIVPFLLAILTGYIFSMIFGIVDYSIFSSVHFIQVPNFRVFGFNGYDFNFSQVLIFAPLAFVTIAEHIGDHVVLGEITGNDFLSEPGLNRTLLGDGVATFVSGALGGPANTTYGENTGVIAISKVGSVWVIGLAAIFAICLGFFGYIQAFITSIPWAVIGGMTVILYGLIASNGVKVLIKDRTDLGKMKNLIVVSTMLVLGLGGATIQITSSAALSGMSLAAIVGILLNLLLTFIDKKSPEQA